MNAQDIITLAYSELGIGMPGEALTQTQLNTGLSKLNLIIDEWDMDELMMSNPRSVSSTLVGGQSAYSIGIGGTFNVPRPDRVTGATLIDVLGNYQFSPLMIVGLDLWNTYTDKLSSQAAPAVVYYDRGGTQQSGTSSRGVSFTLNITAPEGFVIAATINGAGTGYLAGDVVYVQQGNNDCLIKILTVNSGTGAVLTFSILTAGSAYTTANAVNVVPSLSTIPAGTINVYPTPDNLRTYSLTINYDSPFSELASLTSEFAFPKSYRKGTIYVLAMELSSSNGVPLPPQVKYFADEFIRKVKARNLRMVPSDVTMVSNVRGGRSDVYSGDV